jgi:LysM repeat protein
MVVGVGAPIAAVAALWGARQDKARKAAAGEAAAAEDAEGGPGDTATFAVTGGGGVLNAGAPGVGFDQLGQFTEVFTGELGAVREQIEQEFANSATERARREAEIETRFGELDERINEADQRPPPAIRLPTPVPVPSPGAADLETARQEFRDKFGIEPNPLESAAKLRRRIAAAGASSPAPAPAPSTPAPGGAGTTYVVKRGDTLAAIGSRFGVPWRSILAANPASLSRPGDVRTLRVGYRLTIPG